MVQATIQVFSPQMRASEHSENSLVLVDKLTTM